LESLDPEELEKHRKVLFAQALNLTGDSDEAEDLVQQTFLKALEVKDRYDDNDPYLGPSLSLILKNLFYDELRKRKRHGGEFVDIEDVDFSGEDEDFTDFEKKERLQKAISELPEKLKKPMELQLKGYDLKSIAKELNATVQQVKNWMYDARKLLAKNPEILDYALGA
jgi:RNA polymerase sigma-70 factor (ECF subfamily)